MEPDPSGKWGQILRFSPVWVIVFSLVCLVVFVVSGIAYVPAKKMAILIKKTGKDLREGEIIALDSSQKGIQLAALSEGFYWYNPYSWDWIIRDQIEIPKGKVGIQVRLYGNYLKEWQVIAEDGQKGILRDILKPGRYLINPYATKVVLMDAISIPPGFRGVTWNISGKLPQDTHRFLVTDGEIGIVGKTLEAGTYYLNPFVTRIIPVDMRSHRFDTTKEEPIRFPSKDGFEIKMDVTIEWAIDPNRLAEVYVKYVDLRGKENEYIRAQDGNHAVQTSEKDNSESGWNWFKKEKPSTSHLATPTSPDIIAGIVEKVILPNVRSFTRLEGSNYPAIDFVRGEQRILFQNKFGAELVRTCSQEGILIYSTLVRDVAPPETLTKPIQEREIAIRNADKFKKEMEREKQEKDLAMEKKLQEQTQLVTQTKAAQDVAKVDAMKRQQVAITQASQQLEVAKKNYQAALDQGQAKITDGKAKAYVIYQKNKAEAAGLRESAESFGNGQEYVNYLFYQKIAPALSYILSNTDSPFMKLFERVLEKGKDKDFVPTEGKAKELKLGSGDVGTDREKVGKKDSSEKKVPNEKKTSGEKKTPVENPKPEKK